MPKAPADSYELVHDLVADLDAGLSANVRESFPPRS
jgi:hypothetical protein